ncbi:hypothetical protein NESM_000282900 [Novymonas esmeraldas]|uniref:Uncharacterized protein n=1 Tax=Novymonas esmeraldas TaxID=1808958 RepID=A0AAW0FF11_9TRYP
MPAAHSTTSRRTASPFTAAQHGSLITPQDIVAPSSPGLQAERAAQQQDSISSLRQGSRRPTGAPNGALYTTSDGYSMPWLGEEESEEVRPALRPLQPPPMAPHAAPPLTGLRNGRSDVIGSPHVRSSAADSSSPLSVLRQDSGARPDRRRRYSLALQTPLAEADVAAAQSTFSALPAPQQSETGVSSRSTAPLTSRASSGADGVRRAASYAGAQSSTPTSTSASARQPVRGRLEPLARAVSCDVCPAPITTTTPASPPPLRAATTTTFEMASSDAKGLCPVTSAPTHFTGSRHAEGGTSASSLLARDKVLSSSGESPRAVRQPSWKASVVDSVPPTMTAHRGGSQAPAQSSTSTARLSSSAVAEDRGAVSPMHGRAPPGAGTSGAATAARPTTSRSGSEAFSMHTLVSRTKNVDNFDYGLRALGFPVEDCRRVSKASVGLPARSSGSGADSFLMAASNTSGHKTHNLGSPGSTAAAANAAQRSTASGRAGGGSSGSTGASSLPPLTRRISELPSTSSGVRAGSPSMLSGRSAAPHRADISGVTATTSSSLARSPSSSASASESASTTLNPAAVVMPATAPANGGPFSPVAASPPGGGGGGAGSATRPPRRGVAGSAFPASDSAATASPVAPPAHTGSTGVLVSASFRSIVLQPRRVLYNLDGVYGDLTRSSSNGAVNASARSSGSSAPRGSLSSNGATVAGGSAAVRSMAKTSTMTDRSDRVEESGTPGVAEAEASAWVSTTQRGLGSPLQPLGADVFHGYGAPASLRQSDDGASFGDSDAEPSAMNRLTSPRRLHQLRGGPDSSGGGDSVTLEGSVDGGDGRLARGAGGRRSWRHGSGGDVGASPEERRAPYGTHDVFLPFEDGIASAPRGFSSLVLSSFLRHAGSTSTQGTVGGSLSASTFSSTAPALPPPPPHRSIFGSTSSPPSSSTATAMMTSDGDRTCAFSHHSLTQTPACGAAAPSPRPPTTTPPSAAAAPGAARPAGAVAGGLTGHALEPPVPRPGGRGGPQPPSSAAAVAATVAPTARHRVPLPPNATEVAVAAAAAAAAPWPPHGGDGGGAVETPTDLVRAGVLRWTKPRPAAETEQDGEAANDGDFNGAEYAVPHLDSPTADQEGADARGWRTVRGLTVLERSAAAPTTAAARVLAVDGGYTVRVVQGDLVGDCETDECVERCAAAALAGSAADAAGSATPAAVVGVSLPLPSVLVDAAVSRFIEHGENAIAVVMDTADEFVMHRGSSAAAAPTETQPPQRAGDQPRRGSASPAGTGDAAAVAVAVSECPNAGVARAMCQRVVEAFLAFKAAQATAHPDSVVDLKVAAALVPVSLLEEAAAAAPVPPSLSSSSSSPPRLGERGIFYDVVHTATTRDGCRRPLEVATSPVFGTCLNECQWLVVEDESDIVAVFELVRCLLRVKHSLQHGFLYIQFLHQYFIPDEVVVAVAPRVARPAVSPAFTRRRLGAGVPDPPRRGGRHGDIVVSSFTIVTAPYPHVVEAMLDQRADTPWPLLRYALGKGPCTVLAAVNVHEEDAEAAHPLSVLQRLKATQHPRPRRGSMRAYIAEEQHKIEDLKWRLANTADGDPESQATIKRLAVLISKLECGAKDAEDFLADPETVHVPVYVDARKPVHHAAYTELQTAPPSSAHAAVAATGVPQVVALVKDYSPTSGFVGVAGSPRSRKATSSRWLAGPPPATAAAAAGGTGAASVTLTAQLSLTRSVDVPVSEIASLAAASGADVDGQRCAVWRGVSACLNSGFNATVAVVQEAAEAKCAWSLQVTLGLVHGVLKDAWQRGAAATEPSAGLSSPPREVVRVAASVYHCSGAAVADLLRSSSTSRMTTGTAATGMVTFTPAKAAVRPLAGACAPLNVSAKQIGSLAELEEVLRDAVERLRAAQAAAEGEPAGGGGGAAPDRLSRQCLLAPGYTVVSIDLTQRISGDPRRADGADGAGGGGGGGGDDGDDVWVSTLTVVNLGGHCALLSEAVKTAAAAATTTAAAAAAAAAVEPGEEERRAASSAPLRRVAAAKAESPQPQSPSPSAALLMRLLMHRRGMVVCAAALPARPTPEAVDALLGTVRCFTTHAARPVPGADADADVTAASAGAAAAPARRSVRQLIAHLRAVLRVSEGAGGHALVNVRDAVKRALAVLRDPRNVALTAYPFTLADAEALELPAASPALRVDGPTGESSSIHTGGSVSTIGGGGSSSAPDLSADAVGKQWQRQSRPTAAEEASSTAEAAGGVAALDRRARGAQVSLFGPPAAYYGIRYNRSEDPLLLRRAVTASLCQPARLARPRPSAAAAQAGSTDAGGVRGDEREEEDEEEDEEDEQVTVPTVLVLNAATTGAHVKRHGTQVRIPIPDAPTPQYLSLGADELVNIKPTSMGMKSSLLMRSVSCVARGRTAALFISDTESCDATSSIAWLTLRTVMGGIFQSLKMREVEAVRHCAAMRAFLIEEDQPNAFADLLAPQLTPAQPRQPLTRLKYSPFCGPVPADAKAVPVRDLQDVNIALATVLHGARMARQSATTASAEQLHGCIVLQLTFHQFIPAAAGVPADVVVSSLWCVHMGCSSGWMAAQKTAPSSATGALLRYWLGGPCYTTSIAGLSRYVGVRSATWRSVIGAQQRIHPVVLRLPRLGSVLGYIDYLNALLSRCTAAVATQASGELGSGALTTTTTTNTSSSSSANSAPGQERRVCGSSPPSVVAAGAADSVARVTALLKEAHRMLSRVNDKGGTSQLQLSLLAHEERTFTALDGL